MTVVANPSPFTAKYFTQDRIRSWAWMGWGLPPTEVLSLASSVLCRSALWSLKDSWMRPTILVRLNEEGEFVDHEDRPVILGQDKRWACVAHPWEVQSSPHLEAWHQVFGDYELINATPWRAPKTFNPSILVHGSHLIARAYRALNRQRPDRKELFSASWSPECETCIQERIQQPQPKVARPERARASERPTLSTASIVYQGSLCPLLIKERRGFGPPYLFLVCTPNGIRTIHTEDVKGGYLSPLNRKKLSPFVKCNRLWLGNPEHRERWLTLQQRRRKVEPKPKPLTA